MKVRVDFEFPVEFLSDNTAQRVFESSLKEITNEMRDKFGIYYGQYPYVAYQKNLGWFSQE